jgi:multiple sugar transport system permease protein
MALVNAVVPPQPAKGVTSTIRTVRRRRKSPLGSKWTPYLFLAPAFLYIVIFQLFPLVEELYLSFTKTSLLAPNINVWVGFGNFVDLFTSSDFQQVLLTTLIYVVVCVIGAVGVGMIAALLLNAKFRGRNAARALMIVPYAAPGVAVALILSWMVNGQYGIITRILQGIGLSVPAGGVLNGSATALPTILAVTIWQLFPFSAVVLLSALQSVSPEVVEAAVTDGAGPLWVFRAATWPVIRPTVGLLALLTAIWSIRRFELIWLMTSGGPNGATTTLVIKLYSDAFQNQQLGQAAAVGTVGIVISLLLVTASVLVSRRAEKENV